jgi:stage III sporulation protein AB
MAMLGTILKITGCIFVITSCTGMGWLFGTEIKKRLEDLKSAKTIALLLRGDIRYAHTALPEALDNVSRRHEGRLAPFLKRVAKDLREYSGKSFNEIWKSAMNSELNHTSLTKKDKMCLMQFGEQLGYLDKDMQINHIDWYITQVEEDMKEISLDAKDRIRLYRSLGVLFGVLITILIL